MIEYKNSKKILNSSIVTKLNKYLVDYFSVVVIFVVMLIIAFGCFGLLIPKYQNIKKNNEQYRIKKEEQSAQLKLNILAYDNYKRIFDNINENDKLKVNTFLPNKNDSEELLVYVRDMVKKTGLKLVSLDIDSLGEAGKDITSDVSLVKKIGEEGINAEKNINNIEEINISLSLEGVNYQSLQSFIYDLERDSRFFEIENINFSLSARTLSLTLKTYYLK